MAHELVLVEPRAVVGEQGLVGIDTFVGDWPVARLASGGCGGSSLGLGLRLGRRGLASFRPRSVAAGAWVSARWWSEWTTW